MSCGKNEEPNGNLGINRYDQDKITETF